MRESGRFRKRKKTEEERELILKENHEKVCAAAEEAIVLLKNKEDILPLQQGRKLAVIGEYAREPLFQAEGSGKVEGAGKEDAWECAEKWNGADNTPFAMGYRRNNAGSEAEQQKLRDGGENSSGCRCGSVFPCYGFWF